jgi:tRNA threonylcarbamoyladenosine modification (KEOPS) complex  Pcc1 subunit
VDAAVVVAKVVVKRANLVSPAKQGRASVVVGEEPVDVVVKAEDAAALVDLVVADLTWVDSFK